MKRILSTLALAGILLTAGYLIYAQQSGQQALMYSQGSSTPSVIPLTGLVYRIEADCITFVASVCGTPSNGSTIATWADESGNARTGTVNHGTCTFNTAQINAQPAVTFASCGIDLPSGVSTANQNQIGVFVVVKQSTATGSKSDLTACLAAAFGCFKFFAQANMFSTGVDRSDQSALITSISAGDTSWHQFNAVLNNPTGGSCANCLALRKDRAPDGITGLGPFTPIGNDIGSIGYEARSVIEFFPGQIAALLIYDNPSGTTQTGVESYLHDKYGL